MDLKICKTNRCVNCSIRMKHLKSQPVREVTEDVFNILKMWIFPTPLCQDDIICKECFALLSEAAAAPKVEPENPLFGHRKVCFGCGVSIFQIRSCLVPSGSRERNVILEKIPTHLAPHLERVCHPCWTRAVRFVRKQTQNDTDHYKDCKTPSMDVDQQNETENIPLPEFPHQKLHKREKEPSIRSQLYKRVANSSSRCIFTRCKNKERLIIPTSEREMLLSRYRFYVTSSARICQYHLNNDHWDQLQPTICDFTGAEMDAMLTMLESMKDRNIDFNHVKEMPPNLCQYWLGLDATKFHDLLNSVPKLHEEISKPSLALSIYLTKLKTKDTNSRLSGLFNIPRSTLERYMNKARECLNQEFVTPCLDNIKETEKSQQEIQHIDMDATDLLTHRSANKVRESLNQEFVTPCLDNIKETEKSQREIHHIGMDATDPLTHRSTNHTKILFDETTQLGNLV